MVLVGLQAQAAMCLCCCLEGKGKGPLQRMTDGRVLRECNTAGCRRGRQTMQQAVAQGVAQAVVQIMICTCECSVTGTEGGMDLMTGVTCGVDELIGIVYLSRCQA